MDFQSRIEDLKKQLSSAKVQVETWKGAVSEIRGAIQETEYWLSVQAKQDAAMRAAILKEQEEAQKKRVQELKKVVAKPKDKKK